MKLEEAKKMLKEHKPTIGECTDFEVLSAINTVLQELERLQKENEELKNMDLTTVYIKGACDEKERWRNKIREKIEECKKFIIDDKNFSPLHQNDKELLEELLKEE